MDKKRSSFSGGLGFVLAASASAVGLGNLWRFPYLAAQYGGGIFIFVYIIVALTFGFALLTTEIGIGRKTGLSSITAYKKLDKRFGFLGWLAWLVPVIILPYYSVIGGWVMKYAATFITGNGIEAADNNFFGNFIGGTSSPLIWFLIFLALTGLVVLGGVEKGVEKVSCILMPALLILTIGISIYVLTIPGALEGVKYYLLPDFSDFSIKTVCAAIGQLFFSMSIAMGIMVTYGSYTRKEISLVKSVNQIEFFDTLVALLAGMMIVPAVYIFSGEAGMATGGAGLMFITLPKVFEQMTGGNIIGMAFFVLVFFAAITSSISLMETIVSMFIDRLKVSRIRAVIMILIICVVLGVPSSLGNGPWASIKIIGMDFLTFFDFISNSILMPIVALLTCILIGWVVGTKTITDEVSRNGEHFGRKRLYEFIVRYIAPVCLVVILIFYTLVQFGFIHY